MSPKIKYLNLKENERKEYLDYFYKTLSKLDGEEEVKSFFSELLTMSEIVMIVRRLQIAKMLIQEYTYKKIKEKLGVGISTIIQVDRWMDSSFRGYREINSKYYKKSKSINCNDLNIEDPFSFSNLKKKYPAHFLLFNILDDDSD